VDDQFAWVDVLPIDRVADEPLGQIGIFTRREHPPDGVAAVNVEDHIKVVIGPFRRAQQLRDVPRPDLIRAGRQQLGLLVARVAKLVATFADFVVVVQNAVHRADRAVIGVFVE
jgi:hypothetical protein